MITSKNRQGCGVGLDRQRAWTGRRAWTVDGGAMATRWFRPAALDLATLVPGVMALTATFFAILFAALVDRPGDPPPRNDYGISPCPAAAAADLLSPAALQCWFDGPGGRWRTLERVSAHGALVVEVEAAALADAEAIASRFVRDRGGRFAEVLVYVQQERAIAPIAIRRIRWTADTGFEAFDFTVSAGT
jgi:hypothetical protein